MEKSLAKWQENSATLLQPVIAQTVSKVHKAKASGKPTVAAVFQDLVPLAGNTVTHRREGLKQKHSVEK